jgi:hypothetical protein
VSGSEQVKKLRRKTVQKSDLADQAVRRGDLAEAERLCREVLTEFETLGDRRNVAMSEALLGQILIATRRRQDGCALLQEALDIFETLDAIHEARQVQTLIDERCGIAASLTDDGAIRRLMEIIAAFTAAPNWAESRQLLDAHPELLTPQADKVFDAMIEFGSGENQGQIIEQLATHRDLLRLCRMIGVEEAFKRTVDPPEQGI